MAKEVANVKDNASLPAHLQGKGKTVSVGNIDSTDLIIPRVKLLQALSPELDAFDNAKKGVFWHTIASESMGDEVIGIPIVIRKSYALWAPRGDDRGILARSSDAVNWDDWQDEDGNAKTFKVKPKNSPKEVEYTLAATVAESGLAEFGSAIPGDPNSPPAAALTYTIMWYFPEHPDLSPALMINTRSSVKKARQLISKIELRPVDHYAQQYRIGVKQEQTDDGPFYNYDYIAAGYAEQGDYDIAKGLFDKYGDAHFKANEEADDAATGDKPVDKDIPF